MKPNDFDQNQHINDDDDASQENKMQQQPNRADDGQVYDDQNQNNQVDFQERQGTD